MHTNVGKEKYAIRRNEKEISIKISIGAGQIYMKAGPCWNLTKFVRVCERAE